MRDELVTVASFWDPTEAQLAKNRLVEAGIQAALADEATTSMAWFLTNAIGGIKLLVQERDTDEARAVLEEEEVASEQIGEANRAEEKEAEELDRAAEDPLTDRELNADRAFRGAILGLVFVPLQFYVTWLLVKVFVSDERLAADKRRRALIAGAINVPVIVVVGILLRIFGWPVLVM